MGINPRTFEIFGYPISETVVNTWGVMAVLLILGALAGRAVTRIPVDRPPKGWVNVAELVVESLYSFTRSSMGQGRGGFAPYVGTLGLFLAVSNILGVIGIRPPTADINTTVAMASITFFNITYYSLKTRGLLGYIRRFLEPLPFMLPLNIISEIALPVSMALRLFGSMTGGAMIMGLIYTFAPLLVPVLPHLYFDLFSGVIQSFIFVMLTVTFVASGMED